MPDQSCGGETHFHCQSAGFQVLFSWVIRTDIYTKREVFHLIQGGKGPQVAFFAIWVPADETVDTFPLPSHYLRPSYPQFLQALPLFTRCPFVLSPWELSPGKSLGGTMAILLPCWGNPVHTQVPWWCTMCLRCFRPRPLSLKSITRCCEVSTRALAIAIPRGPEKKES